MPAENDSKTVRKNFTKLSQNLHRSTLRNFEKKLMHQISQKYMKAINGIISIVSTLTFCENGPFLCQTILSRTFFSLQLLNIDLEIKRRPSQV